MMASQPTTTPSTVVQGKMSEGLVCKDFVFRTDGNIHLHGDYSHINSLLSCVDTGYKLRFAADSAGLDALTASIASLDPPPVSPEQLLGILQSDHYVQIAHRIALLSGDGDDLRVTQLLQDLIRRGNLRDLNEASLRVVLFVLREQHGFNYALGVLKHCGQHLGLDHFQVQVHKASEEDPDKIVWVFFDETMNLDLHAFGDNWATLTRSLRHSTQPAPMVPPTYSSGWHGSSSGRFEDATGLPPRSREQSSSFDDSEFICRKSRKKRRAPPRKVASTYDTNLKASKRVINAPPRESLLSLDLMTDITVADLIVYYPEHLTNWPGLALLVNHYNICNPLERQGWAGKVADMINKSRGLKSSHPAAVSRHNFRNWTTEAIEKLLGKGYSISERDHTVALYAAVEAKVGRKPTGRDITDFLQAHLFDTPYNVSGMIPPLSLDQVGAGVHTHLNTAFGLRVQQAMRGTTVRPGPAIQGKYHPLLDFIGDDTMRARKEKLDRSKYPEGYDEDELIKNHLKDLHGEPLLFVHRRYEISEIIRKIGDYHGITGKKLRDLYCAFRKRKASALKLRAERLGISHDVAQARYEIEASEMGHRNGRMPRYARDKPVASRELLTHRAQQARETGKAMTAYPWRGRIGSQDARFIAEVAGDVPMANRLGKRRQRGPNSPPPLPPLSVENSRQGSLVDAEGEEDAEHNYSKPTIPSAEYISKSVEQLGSNYPGSSVNQTGYHYPRLPSLSDQAPAGVRHQLPSVSGNIIPTGARMNLRFDSVDPGDWSGNDVRSPHLSEGRRSSQGMSSFARDAANGMPTASRNSLSGDPFRIESVLHSSQHRPSATSSPDISNSHRPQLTLEPTLFASDTEASTRKRRFSDSPVSPTSAWPQAKRQRPSLPELEICPSPAGSPKPAPLVRRASSLMRALARRPIVAPRVGSGEVAVPVDAVEQPREHEEQKDRKGSEMLTERNSRAGSDSLDSLFEDDEGDPDVDELVGL